ncbi:amidohydrolase [Actinoplanes sp. NPDC049596]|uniref:amidohydrolase family protein n=1 Tax=unclassified Actinoplanes TaxID=2626549 RepID=UPI003417FDDD
MTLTADSIWWNGRLHQPAALHAATRPALLTDIPADARRLPGTLLPGLVDAHVHSALVDLATVRAGGIAAVWDLGGEPSTVAAVAADHERRRMPRIRYAGPFLTAPGGYPSDRSWAPPGSWRDIHSPAEAIEAAAEAKSFGATLIKVTAHAGGPLLSPEIMAAIVGEGLPVVVHAEGPGTVKLAVDAGAAYLAHTPWTEPLEPGLARACAEQTTWISTLDIHGWGRPTPEQATAIANLRLFLGNGGKVRYGTDLGNGPLPPAINPREIRLLQNAGMTPNEILLSMTGDDFPTAPTDSTPPHPPAHSNPRQAPADSNPPHTPAHSDPRQAPADRDPSQAPAGGNPPHTPAGGTAPQAPAGTDLPWVPYGALSWVPGGLDLDPTRFADSLATARVLDSTVRPR